MKIEKLNKENIKEFIIDMGIGFDDIIANNIDKQEYYGIKEDDKFILGFDSLSFVDTISIIFYNNKLSDEKFYECIDFLNNSLVVDSHLIIEVFDEKYMTLLERKYRCKEVLVTYGKNKSINLDNITMKEKYADIEMNSIKYMGTKDIVSCNLVKQNIQDEKMIKNLHEYFVNDNVNIISFIIYNDNFDFMKNLGYECVSRSYLIKDNL